MAVYIVPSSSPRKYRRVLNAGLKATMTALESEAKMSHGNHEVQCSTNECLKIDGIIWYHSIV